MYNPDDPRQRNWHRQDPVGRGGGFEQEPRFGTPAHDWRDQGMYAAQDPRRRPLDHDPRDRADYRAASDEGEAERFAGRDRYSARTGPAHREERRDDDYSRPGGDTPRGGSSFVRHDRGTWGALGSRPNFGPDASHPGYPPGAPPGPFAGRGPKGYRRSDERISEDVCELLTADPDLDAGEIEISVREGEVTLSGTVDSRRSKRRAEDLIEGVAGIREIHNQLRLRPS